MYILLVYMPFFNFIVIYLLEFFFGQRIAVLSIAHSYLYIILLSITTFNEICTSQNAKYITIGTWINCGTFKVNWGFIFDALSISMLLMISIVSGMVHFYSLGYMKTDLQLVRFISFLSLFTFFMFLLVTADNYVLLFFGWEGIGLCSFLLISFWNTRIQAVKSAFKALVVNRVGDFGFLCGILLIYYYFRTFDFATIFVLAPFFERITLTLFEYKIASIDLICFSLFIGTMGKSAQLGLHTWLPDAMEGPTPVSALIHAATLVTAGVFLVIRSSPLFELSPNMLFFLVLSGGFTSVFSGLVGITLYDIKKIIAYSTCSQLGYMVYACGLSAYDLSFFHLINHAFFKALLFLSAGAVIHAMSGEQDIRKYGELHMYLPYTYSMLLIGSLSLIGTPFLSGFYSKDLIIETGYITYVFSYSFTQWIGNLAVILTAIYSTKILWYTFWMPNNSYKYGVQNLNEVPKNMAFALGVLAFGSIFSGFFFKEYFLARGSRFWGNIIHTKHYIGNDLEYIYDDCGIWPVKEFGISTKKDGIRHFEICPDNFFVFDVPTLYKSLPTICTFFGIIVYIALIWAIEPNQLETKSWNNKKMNALKHAITCFLKQKWGFDCCYNYFIARTVLKCGYETTYLLLDKGFLEFFGSYNLGNLVFYIGKKTNNNQPAVVYQQASLILLGLIVLIFINITM